MCCALIMPNRFKFGVSGENIGWLNLSETAQHFVSYHLI